MIVGLTIDEFIDDEFTFPPNAESDIFVPALLTPLLLSILSVGLQILKKNLN